GIGLGRRGVQPRRACRDPRLAARQGQLHRRRHLGDQPERRLQARARASGPEVAGEGGPMPPIDKTKGGKPAPTATYAAPTPKVSRQKRGKVLTAAEKAAFLASRPDLKPS